MGGSTVTRPDCDMCVKHGRCSDQGGHCAAVLFAWAADRETPVCEGYVASVRAETGFVPLSPFVWDRAQENIIRRIR